MNKKDQQAWQLLPIKLLSRLSEFIFDLSNKIKDLKASIEDNTTKKQLKKKRLQKGIQDKSERIEKIKQLDPHLEKLLWIQDLLHSNELFNQLQWNEFQQLLETLYENVDNPMHNSELYGVYNKIETLFKEDEQQIVQYQNQPTQQSLDRFFSNEPNRQIQPLQSFENKPMIDQNCLPYKLKMMEISFKNMPQGSDYYPPSSSKERLSQKSLLPKYKMLTHLVFPKLENETLFYVFYYHKEDYEKNLAARELKTRGWLYHKKFGLWMKKADTKGVFEQTDKYIKGQFLYFDPEKGNQQINEQSRIGWLQRKKTDFTFKFQYMDNEIN